MQEHDSTKSDPAFTRVRRLSQFLDNAVTIPGTSYRVGIDPLLGLVPGMGDYLGAVLSGYIIFEGARLGASRATLIRMFFNVVLETIIGLIPGLGDIFDVFWKANAKNQSLLEKQLASAETREKADWLFLIALLLGLVVIIIGITSLSFWILISVIQGSPFL
ncbi:MAG: DUF4112 domain-containing protein [Cyanobacteria bacterium SW_9_44_58]|nr:MAG: DUF4112 domain-containing protein [Cyanobacteria bacterium SW_9_44_58]